MTSHGWPDAQQVRESWESERWSGIERPYSAEQVCRLRGTVQIEHTLAKLGAERFKRLLETEQFIRALGAVTGSQALQMVRAGLKTIYVSGWQVAADANASGQENIDWYTPIVADAEAGFGGVLNSFELMKSMIEAGAAAVHFEDQLASEKKCGHLGGKVLVPTRQFIRTLTAARLAADVVGVPTFLIARTDADGAKLLSNDADPRDLPYVTGERTPEGFYRIKSGLEAAIARGVSYAPYADIVWCET